MPKVKFKHVLVEEFDVIYNDMCKQFPQTELKSLNQFQFLLKNENYCLFLIEIEAKICGYLIFLKDEIFNILWLDYFAIFKEYHSKGFGSLAILAFCEYFKNYKGCYIELEKPCSFLAERRIKFYKKLGAKKLDIDYFYPNKDGFLPMDLYFLPFNENTTNPSCGEVFGVVENVFKILHFDLAFEDVYSKISSNILN